MKTHTFLIERPIRFETGVKVDWFDRKYRLAKSEVLYEIEVKEDITMEDLEKIVLDIKQREKELEEEYMQELKEEYLRNLSNTLNCMFFMNWLKLVIIKPLKNKIRRS